jgi:hypothetical protein
VKPSQDPAETLRELIREAHGAAKDLRQATRDARAAAAVLRQEMTAELQQALNDLVGRQAAEAQQAYDTATAAVQGYVDESKNHLAKILGAADAAEITRQIIDTTARALADRMEPGLTATLQTAMQAALRPVRG